MTSGKGAPGQGAGSAPGSVPPWTRSFEAVIEKGRGGGAFVTVPFDVEEVAGTRGQVPVTATFDGEPYRGSLAAMGGGNHALGMTLDLRRATGKDIGDTVHVTVAEDAEPRRVEVPAELEKVFEDAGDARELFDQLSYTHRKEYARWVSEAKKQDTRDRRAAKAVDMLREGKRL